MTKAVEGSSELSACRQKIDKIDEEIYKLLQKRAELALAIGAIKKVSQADCSYYVPEREAEILGRFRERKGGLLRGEALCAIYEKIIEACRALQLNRDQLYK